MVSETTFQFQSRSAKLFLILATFGLVVLVLYPFAGIITMMYSEWKGPHRSITDVADLDGDGDLELIVGHTRWESADISWAGITLLINQGDGQSARGDQELPGGFASARVMWPGGPASLLAMEMRAVLRERLVFCADVVNVQRSFCVTANVA